MLFLSANPVSLPARNLNMSSNGNENECLNLVTVFLLHLSWEKTSGAKVAAVYWTMLMLCGVLQFRSCSHAPP